MVSSDGIQEPNVVVGYHQIGSWTKFETIWDFVGGTFQLYLNDVFVGTFPTLVRRPLWLAFASNVPVTFDDDDVSVLLDLRGERQNCDGNNQPIP